MSKTAGGEHHANKAPPSESARLRLGRMTRTTVPRHELDFISKIGRIDPEEALALLQRHMGDREGVFSELVTRLRR